jgi:peptidoglycan/LPS O-acetylase OafA/YrhL
LISNSEVKMSGDPLPHVSTSDTIEKALTNPASHKNNGYAVRLVLALGVLFQHCYQVENRSTWLMDFPWVACFLTLSGYLVLASRFNSRSTGHFLWKRLLRIWPAMAVAFALCALLEGWGPDSRHVVEGTFFLVPPGGHSFWTIGLEEILYLVLSALFLLGAYRSSAAAWAGVVLSFFANRVLGAHVSPNWMYLLNLVPMFFVGNLLYIYRERIKWNGFLAVVFAIAFLLIWNLPGKGWHMVYCEMLLTYPLIWTSIYARDLTSWLAKSGDYSYNLFLYHSAVLTWLFGRMGSPSLPVLITTLLAIVVPLCILSWRYVESVALRGKDRLPRLGWRERKASEAVA